IATRYSDAIGSCISSVRSDYVTTSKNALPINSLDVSTAYQYILLAIQSRLQVRLIRQYASYASPSAAAARHVTVNPFAGCAIPNQRLPIDRRCYVDVAQSYKRTRIRNSRCSTIANPYIRPTRQYIRWRWWRVW